MCLEGWGKKSQRDELELSSVAVHCIISRFPGSLMFMQGIGKGRGYHKYNRGTLFWLSFRSNEDSLAISTVVDVDGKQALFYWSEVGFLK